MESESRVFVVDDDPEMLASLRSLFEEVNLPVQTYSSAREFLAACDATCEGCLVLDVRMPGMDGIALHKTLKAKGITMPVIIITGHGDIPMAVDAVQAGALDFLEKPFRPQRLLERVNQALAQDVETHRRRAASNAIEARLALLTPRQREVMGLMVAGETTKTIAALLGLSPKTVDHHRAQITEKMQAGSVIDLVRMVQTVEDDRHPLQHHLVGAACP